MQRKDRICESCGTEVPVGVRNCPNCRRLYIDSVHDRLQTPSHDSGATSTRTADPMPQPEEEGAIEAETTPTEPRPRPTPNFPSAMPPGMKMLDKFKDFLGDGSNPQEAFDSFVEWYMSTNNPLDLKNVIVDADCYSIVGIAFQVVCQIDGTPYSMTEVKGTETDQAETYSYNDSYVSVHRVTNSQTQIQIDITIAWYWDCTPSLLIVADRTDLKVGETTRIEAHLLCGHQGLAGQRIVFLSGPAGPVHPGAGTTSSQGDVVTTLYAATEGTVVVEAVHLGCPDVPVEKRFRDSVTITIEKPEEEETQQLETQQWRGSLEYEFHGVENAEVQCSGHHKIEFTFTFLPIPTHGTLTREEGDLALQGYSPEELKIYKVTNIRGRGRTHTSISLHAPHRECSIIDVSVEDVDVFVSGWVDPPRTGSMAYFNIPALDPTIPRCTLKYTFQCKDREAERGLFHFSPGEFHGIRNRGPQLPLVDGASDKGNLWGSWEKMGDWYPHAPSPGWEGTFRLEISRVS